MKTNERLYQEIGRILIEGRAVMGRAMMEDKHDTALLIGRGLEKILEAADLEAERLGFPKRPEDTP